MVGVINGQLRVLGPKHGEPPREAPAGGPHRVLDVLLNHVYELVLQAPIIVVGMTQFYNVLALVYPLSILTYRDIDNNSHMPCHLIVPSSTKGRRGAFTH